MGLPDVRRWRPCSDGRSVERETKERKDDKIEPHGRGIWHDFSLEYIHYHQNHCLELLSIGRATLARMPGEGPG